MPDRQTSKGPAHQTAADVQESRDETGGSWAGVVAVGYAVFAPLLGSNLITPLFTMALACAGLLWIGRNTPFGEIVVQQMMLGGGLGLLVPPMTTSLLGSVKRSQAGVASGTLNAMRQTGSLLGIALFGSLIAGRGEFFSGMRGALIISLLVLAVGASLTWQLRQRGGDRKEPSDRTLSASETPPTWPTGSRSNQATQGWRASGRRGTRRLNQSRP
jgi:hypothetical protein